jgi:DNA-binding transcriptional LysR family regulator
MKIYNSNIKIDDAVAFVAMIRYRSISGAANVLGVTQPSVTRRIQSLEEELGVTLLDRNTRPPKPTAIGLQVFEKCQNLVRSAMALKSLVEAGGEPQGIIRIGMTQRVAELALGELLEAFARRYPELEIQVVTRWSADLQEMVLYNELHAAIIQGPGNAVIHEEFVTRKLSAAPSRVVAPKGHFPRLTLTLAECAPGPWILNPEGCQFRKALINTFETRGLAYRIRMDGFGTELQMQMVARGMGLSVLPSVGIQSSVYRDRVDLLELRDFQMESHSWLIHNPSLGNLEQAVDFCGQFITDAIQAKRVSG